MNINKIEEIKSIVKKIALNETEKFLQDTTPKKLTYNYLNYLFPEQRKQFTVLHGISTSWGTTLWEPICNSLAELDGWKVNRNQDFNDNFPELDQGILNLIDDFKDRKKKEYMDLSFNDFQFDLKNYLKNHSINLSINEKMLEGKGVDIWIENDYEEILIDIKTVDPNRGDAHGFLDQLLRFQTARIIQSSGKKITSFIAFPHNPHFPDDYWKKGKSKVHPLIPSVEVKAADEFWDLISGCKGAYECIILAFKELSEEKGDYIQKLFKERTKYIINNH